MIYRLSIGAIVSLCLLPYFVQAQVFNVPPRLEETPEIKEGIPKVKQPDPLSVPGLLDQESIGAPKYITIRSITFDGNTLIPDDQIRQAIAPYEGATILTTQINEIILDINRLYSQEGYDGSGAIATPKSTTTQDLIDLKLQIIEAKVAEITVEGAGRLKPYVQKQLRSLKGNYLNRDELYNELRFLLDDDRIENLTLSTLNKPQLDQKELRVDLEIANPIQATLLINNGRSPSVGSFERGLSSAHTNLVGIGDQLSIEYRNTEGSNILGLGYDIPVNGSGGEIQLDYLYGNAKVISEPFREFDIRSKTQIFSVGYSQPVLRQSNDNLIQSVTLGIRASRTENEDSILSIPFPVTEGANDDGRIRSTRVDLTQAFSRRTRNNTLLLTSEFSLGLGLGTTNDDSFGNGEFFRWTGSGLFAQRLNKRFLSLTNVNVQLADRDLVGNEQFTLGGRGSVRGTVLNQFARTNGVNLVQEFRYKAYDKNEHRIDLIGFFDFASGWNDEPQFLEESESLATIGVGVSHNFSDQFRTTLEYGIPLFGAENNSKSLQADGLLLSFQFSF